MTNESVDQTVTTQEPSAPATPARPAAPTIVRTESRQVTTTDPGASEMTRRVIVLVFGLIQIVIGLRFILLLLDAREANGLVSGILNVSQIFVAPFDGILRTDALHSAGSVLDITAIVALIGWTILEAIIIWVVGIFRRQQTA
jgi:hypothetical protein